MARPPIWLRRAALAVAALTVFGVTCYLVGRALVEINRLPQTPVPRCRAGEVMIKAWRQVQADPEFVCIVGHAP